MSLPDEPPKTPDAALRILVRLARSSAMIQLPIDERRVWDEWLEDVEKHATIDLGPNAKAQRCGRCGMLGHKTRTCKAIRCSRCGEMGHHTKRTCPFPPDEAPGTRL